MAQFSNLGDLFQDPQVVDEYAQLRQAQQQSMQEHTQYAETLRAREAEVQERQGDLQATGQFFRLLDTNIPRPARDFLFREGARSLGIDPKSETAREVGKLLTNLDPDSATAVRSMLVAEQERAGPGAMRRMYASILRGEIPISSLLERVQAHQAQTTLTAQQEAGQMFPQPAVNRPGEAQPQVTQVSDTEQPVQPTQPAPRAADPRLGRTPIENFVDPGVASSLPGVNPRDMTIEQMLADGWSGPIVSSDQATQRKAQLEIGQLSSAYTRLQGRLGEMYQLLENPSIVGPTGAVQSWAESLQQQARVGVDWIRGALGDRSFLNSVEGVLNPIIAQYPRLEENARATARFKSLLVDAAFQIARQQNPTGVISQADFENALRTIGNSWSSNQTREVLGSLGQRQWSDYVTRTRELAGNIPFRFDRLTSEDAQRLRQDPTVPTEFFRAWDEYQARIDRQAARDTGRQPLVPSLPGQDPNRALPAEPQQRQDTRTDAQRERDELRQRLNEEQQRTRRIEDERLGRERRAATRQDVSLELSVERFKQEIETFHRAQRWRDEDKAEREMNRIRQAFDRLSRLIAGSAPRVGGMPSFSSGGGQDARAFQLPERRQRQAPNIPQARRQ